MSKRVWVDKNCPVCKAEFRTVTGKKEKTTCSCACSNKHFRSGDQNGNYIKRQRRIENGETSLTYREICWQHHKKECVICGEFLIVEVHHHNEQHDDNRPENLVPLCPTHHQYLHSRYRALIIEKVESYIQNWARAA